MDTAIILGAGFSFVAGLPLTRNLFDTNGLLPRSQSSAAEKNHSEVSSAYSVWLRSHPGTNAEEWLLDLYRRKGDPLQEIGQQTTWSKALRFALARLVDLPPGKNSHYYFGICTSKCHPIHQRFWRRIEDDFGSRVVATLNYDLLVEQALHAEDSKHRGAPRCYYGGFPYVQTVRKMTDVTKRRYELVRLGNEVVLYKLHGSLNWAWERHAAPTLKIHDDVRAIFRHNDRIGVPAVIPPIPEKEMPPEFSQIWDQARRSLSECPHWIVCGYSLPPYDVALRNFFEGILSKRNQASIFILSPDSPTLAKHWQAICPKSTQVRPLPGLPEALDRVWK
jgi:hypothetical protein